MVGGDAEAARWSSSTIGRDRETFLVLMKRAVLVHRPESRQTLSAMEDDDGACPGGLCIENVEYVYLSRHTILGCARTP